MSFIPKLRWLAQRRRKEAEIHEELQFHLEEEALERQEDGLAPDEARRAAHRDLGNVTSVEEEVLTVWIWTFWERLLGDIRYAWRLLWKSPVFTAIAIGSLALGIGANTAIFTLAKEMLLDRLHVRQPGEVRLLRWTAPGKSVVFQIWGYGDTVNGWTTSRSFSYPVYRELREQNRKQGVLGDLFAFKDIGTVTATVDGQAQTVRCEMVSGNYYGELGVIPSFGRGIAPADDAVEGAGAVVVISKGFWRHAFASSPQVIGKAIAINGQAFTVIGVNPPEFTGASSAHLSPQVFVPFSIQPVLAPEGSLEKPTEWWMQIMARAKPDISGARAEAALSAALTASVQNSHTAKSGVATPRVQLEDGSRGENKAARQYNRPVAVLLAVAGVVLLLACVNLANLLLARASSREREVAVRLALGAGRGRILRQALTESLMLSFAGGTAGFALGWASRNVIPKLMSSPWDPTQLSARIDWGVLAFTAILSLLTGLLFGIVPAFKATRTQASAGLKENAAAITRRRTGYAGKVIVVFQLALSTLLVVGAGLFLRTISNLNHVDVGFRVDHLLLFEISQPRATYPPPKDTELHEEIADRLAALPGVESVTSSALPMISGSLIGYALEPLDRPVATSAVVAANWVGDHFFATMGIPIAAGRDFGPQDSASGESAAIVNESLAQYFWGETNVIGRHFKAEGKMYTIVGVVKGAGYYTPKAEPLAQLFLSYRQQPGVAPRMTYEVRTHMPASSLALALQKAVAGIDPNLPLIAVRTQQQQIDAMIGDERMFATLTAGFGLLALVLASIGIYGVMAYKVAERTREIGIRVALGARARQILTMVLGETWRMSMVGVIVGLGAAFAFTRLVKEMLYGVKTYDPLTLAGSAALLCLVALAAGFTPARRASKVDPMTALRHE